ncbi:hypothetical protein JHK82_013933 [Glycine max]|nr:hypothetical protein JHK86_013942 [Glycine max]KAG5155964.1 hypothetical protein JHK82_013933 [Glycine max]
MHGQQLVSKHCHALTDPSYSLVKTVANNNNTLLRNLLSVNASKVDEAAHKFDEHAPSLVKQVATQVTCLVQKVTHKAEKVVSEAQSGGARAAANYVATESKQIVLSGSVKLWTGLNQYPSFHSVAEMAVPLAAEEFNELMTSKLKWRLLVPELFLVQIF